MKHYSVERIEHVEKEKALWSSRRWKSCSKGKVRTEFKWKKWVCKRKRRNVIFFLAATRLALAGALPFLATSTDLCATQFHLRACYQIRTRFPHSCGCSPRRCASAFGVGSDGARYFVPGLQAADVSLCAQCQTCRPEEDATCRDSPIAATEQGKQQREGGCSRSQGAGCERAISERDILYQWGQLSSETPNFFTGIEKILLLCSMLCTAFEILHCVLISLGISLICSGNLLGLDEFLGLFQIYGHHIMQFQNFHHDGAISFGVSVASRSWLRMEWLKLLTLLSF